MGLVNRATLFKAPQTRFVLTFLSFTLCTPSLVFGGSVGGTGGATEWTQLSNLAELRDQSSAMVDQTRKLRQQLDAQVSMYKDMAIQGKKVTQSLWGETAKDLVKLGQISKEGQALAFSSANMDALFKEKYKGFEAYKKKTFGDSKSLSDQYSEWSATSRESLQGALKSANLQYEQLSSEQDLMSHIQKMGSSAKGRMEALQVGNMIAAQQVSQIQKLRSLMMSQMQMQSSYLTFEANQRDASKAHSLEFFKSDLSKLDVTDGESF